MRGSGCISTSIDAAYEVRVEWIQMVWLRGLVQDHDLCLDVLGRLYVYPVHLAAQLRIYHVERCRRVPLHIGKHQYSPWPCARAEVPVELPAPRFGRHTGLVGDVAASAVNQKMLCNIYIYTYIYVRTYEYTCLNIIYYIYIYMCISISIPKFLLMFP